MVIISGSLAYDYILSFHGKFADHIVTGREHVLNLSFYAPEMLRGFGGTAGNIAYGLSLLGVPAAILGMAGNDFQPYANFLRRCKVQTKFIAVSDKHHTSTAFGITDLADNQIWGFHPGADDKAALLTTKKINGQVDFAVIAPQNPKAMLKFAREYRARNIPYMFDPGMQLPKFSSAELKQAMAGAAVVIGNDYETSLMEKKMNLARLGSLSAKGKVVVSTLGAKGCLVFSGGKQYKIKPARARKVADPSGAGDAFRAGFTAGLMAKLPPERCAQLGSVAAVYAVESKGTSRYHYTRAEFRKRFRSNFGNIAVSF